MMPRVSVLMPVYNCEAHLLASLESLSAQTFTDFEIIVVDDGSNDGTSRMLDAFSLCEPRCRVIHTKNRGIVAALNTAAATARGEYLARLDGDDIARTDRFAKQVAFLDDETTCVCVGSLYRIIDENGKVFAEQKPFNVFRQTDLDVFPPYVASLPHPSIMMRRSAFFDVGGYRSSFPYAEDHDLFLRLARLGRIDIVQLPLLDYRVHLSSLSARNLELQTESMLCAVLAAIVVERGGVDPAEIIEMPDRLDYLRVIDDPAFQQLFEFYGELSIANGAANRRLRGIAAGRLLRLVLHLFGSLPNHIADRRFFTLFKLTARSIVRLTLGRV